MIPIATPCTIVNRTAAGLNTLGETVWTSTSRPTVCHLNTLEATEDNDPDQRATSTAKGYFHADETIDEHDRVVVAGVSYEVAGIPVARRRAPTGHVHHLEVPLKVAR